MLVQFWTFTCINWLRTLPYVRAWAEQYKDDGLIVVGAHTPEFWFEADVDNIRRAVTAMRIDYPVAVDSEYAIWDAFANRYWPALYFVDREGKIRDEHFGEGRYEESERVIQRLLVANGVDTCFTNPGTSEMHFVAARQKALGKMRSYESRSPRD